MGLFFDQDWFDERLQAAGLSRASMARAAGMTIDEVEMVFRDQRELDGPEVSAIARILSVHPSEVASRAGTADADSRAPRDAHPPPGSMRATGHPEFAVTRQMITGIHERLDRLERMLEMVLAKLDRR